MADLAKSLATRNEAIHCIDMHTTGEPTRIAYRGFPSLTGTLLEQRAQAKRSHDHIRRKLMFEPRGHRDMYGAILRPGDRAHRHRRSAHRSFRSPTNDGYSTMCGHATTIALGRFLMETHDQDVFARRDHVKHNSSTKTSVVVLHAPCGLVQITVPTNDDGTKSDPTRPVTHVSVPSFATGLDVRIEVAEAYKWPELGDRTHVTADFSYGGAFYCFILAEEMGFHNGLGSNVDISAMDRATKNLKAAVNQEPALRYLFTHPHHEDLGFLYSVIVVDDKAGRALHGSNRGELGLCFFSDQHIDRSPTGSGVAARIALAYAKGRDEPVTYHSMVSHAKNGQGGFIGKMHQDIGKTHDGLPVVRVQIEGFASYVGVSSFVVEESDALGDDGFLFEQLCK